MQTLAEHGAVVLGVSTDSAASHRKFSTKYDLNFPLLADTEKTVVEMYGAWQEKTRFGRKSMGIVRSTVIIDEDGKVHRVFPNVNVNGHFEEVLEALK